MKRVAIYARVSTDDQNAQTQVDELTRACALKGWADPIIFRDNGISGTKTSRPAFDKMMASVRARDFDVVMVWRFDRASRSTKHLLSLLDELQGYGVDFVSLREQIDTTTAAGKLMFTMVSAFAQFERDLISDRTKAAMARLKTEGKAVGKPRKYDRQRILDLAAQGKSPAEISEETGASKPHIRKILAA